MEIDNESEDEIEFDIKNHQGQIKGERIKPSILGRIGNLFKSFRSSTESKKDQTLRDLMEGDYELLLTRIDYDNALSDKVAE